jgi:FtsZ-binding cell division protein ZapB
MDDILNVLSERIERAVAEINRLRGEQHGMSEEKQGLVNRIGELEERVRQLEGEKGAFAGRIEEIVKKLDNLA